MKEGQPVSRIKPGEIRYLADGRKLSAKERKKKKSFTKRPSETAEHEIKHAYVAEKVKPNSVKLASIVPGPGYLGITEVSVMHPAAAAAPDAHGMRGTGHDLRVVAAIGANIEGARAAAKSIMAGNETIIYEVASVLEEKKTMSGHEIRAAIYEAEHGSEIVLYISDAVGRVSEFTASEPTPFSPNSQDFQEALAA